MKLQNNFTTVEQSRRLLELGVPANSADMYWDNYYFTSNEYKSPIVRNKHSYRYKDFFKMNKEIYTPCFSVGRLIEIYITCIEHYTGDERLTFGQYAIRLGMIDCIIAAIKVACDDGDMDFSKL